jgi:hypothetical protein
MCMCGGCPWLVRSRSFLSLVGEHSTLTFHLNLALGSHWKPRSVDVQPAATSWGIDSDDS